MKKYIKRLIFLFTGITLLYQNNCYADVIVIDPVDRFIPIAFIIGLIGVTILITSTISFFTLKKQNKNGENIDLKALEENKKIIKKNYYIWGMVLAIIVLLYLLISDNITGRVFLIPIYLFIVSVILYKKKRKISYIICGTAIALVGLIILGSIISNNITKNHNNKFLKYIDNPGKYWRMQRYTSNIEGLITEVLNNNNKNTQKVAIIYDETRHESINELKQLLNSINKDTKYFINYVYNDKKQIKDIYIKSYSQEEGIYEKY